ncbi:MAG: hypothetical protein KDD44_12725, partial [Bdellovibrionales bacterium]|nr:hypothetical protein [Bdellovibrionales bacterium]
MGGLSIEQWLIVAGSVIYAGGTCAYVLDTVAGRTKPNRVTYAMWSLAPLVGAGAAMNAGADLWSTIPIFVSGILPLFTLLASYLNPRSYWKLTPFDLACGALSLAALALWLLVDHPTFALVLAVAGDAFASYPTVKKAIRYPETETGVAYLASALGVTAVLPAIPEWTLENCIFQTYLILLNALLAGAVLSGPRRVRLAEA